MSGGYSLCLNPLQALLVFSLIPQAASVYFFFTLPESPVLVHCILFPSLPWVYFLLPTPQNGVPPLS